MNLRFLTPLLLLPLGACSLWVDYVQPETPTPTAWQGPVQPPEAAVPVWPDTQWWSNFKSTELTTLMTQAREANFDIKAAIARMQQADAQRRIAGGALWPSIDATAGATRTRPSSSRNGSGTVVSTSSTTATTATSTQGKSFNSLNAGLNASYELDFWGKNAASVIAAEATLDASTYDAETIRLSIEASVANTYFDMLASKARLATAQQNEKNAQDVLKAINLRFKVGVATALDVAQQQNVVAGQTIAIAPLQLQLRKDQDAMAILVGKLPEEVKLPDAGLMDVAIPQVAPGLPSELLLRRPDVQNAEAQLIAANANIVNARAQFFPSIVLTGQYGWQSTALNQLFTPQSLLWSFGANLTQPIFEGGALEGNLDLNKARYDELLQNYQKSVIASFSDVEDALANVQEAEAQEKAQLDATESARRAFAYSQQQFQGGIIDITVMLDTQRTLFAAEDALLQVRLAHLQATVSLYNALGGGWKKPDATSTDNTRV